MKILIFAIISSQLLLSCVGSIRKSGANKAEEVAVKSVSLTGISSGKYISDTKIMIKFKGATGGSGSYYYHAFLNGGTVPAASVPAETLVVDGEGLLSLTISDLRVNTAYHISMQAYDVENDIYSERTDGIVISTAPFHLPVFEGLQLVSNMPGVEAMTQLKLQWIPASRPTIIIGDVFSSDHSISGYYIYYANTLAQLMDNLANNVYTVSLNNPSAAEYILGSSIPLVPGEGHYITVRARNSASPNQFELNEKYIFAKTLTDRPIEFDGITSATIPNNVDGFTKADVVWPACVACSEFRLYALKEARPVDPAKDELYRKATLTSDYLQGRISGLDPHTNYYVYVVACRSSDQCSGSDMLGQNQSSLITTTPPVAPFDGLRDNITQPEGTIGLTSLILSWYAADSASGAFNEYRLFRVDSNGDPIDNNDSLSGIQSQITAYSSANPNGIYIDSSTPLSTKSTSIQVSGVRTDQTVCFVLKPYSSSPLHPILGPRTILWQVVRCGKPTYTAPDFSGIKNLCENQTFDSLEISWDRPTNNGVFTHYEVFYKDSAAEYNGSSAFSFADAISDTAESVYHKVMILAGGLETSYALVGLPFFATNYQIGISTYYQNSEGQIFRVNASAVATDNSCKTTNPELRHNGWDDIFAIGPKTSGLANGAVIAESLDPLTRNYREDPAGSTSGIIRLKWDAFSIYGSTRPLSDFAAGGLVTQKVYYSTISESGPFTEVATIPISVGVSKYEIVFGSVAIDGQMVQLPGMAPGTTYWFKVVVDYDGTELNFYSGANTHPSVVRVILPPENMALMHRMMANKEMCEILHRPILPSDNYKCEYNGLASVLEDGQTGPGSPRYYDMLHDLLVDRFEVGCNFSTTGCSGGACLGTGDPVAVADQYTVYYRRDNPYCSIQGLDPFVETPGASWKRIADVSLDRVEANAEKIASNRAYLPPLVYIGQATAAWRICQGTKINITTNSTAVEYGKRILRRKEFISAAAWRAQDWGERATGLAASYTAPRYMYGSGVAIRSVEDGSGTDTYCNANLKGGNFANNDYSDDRYPGTLTSVNTNASRALRTGSNGTWGSRNCQSRYGIQDMTGNIEELNSDQIFCNLTTCTADIIPSIDAANKENLRNGDGNYLEFSAVGIATAPSTTFYDWKNFNNANFFSPVLGLGLSCSGDSCGGTSPDDNMIMTWKTPIIAGATYVFPNDGGFYVLPLNNTVNSYMTFLSGYNWSANASSRYTLNLGRLIDQIRGATGVRCAVPIPSD
ncbi:MAG: hypothetical protein A2504_10095 [Bdellovibrionales bacterium RIFOXYD12_FULL_39_22]|nr:MAG: hypothetical protein A2385_17730 [Bdellovibrionales bacterium RIFOXYB1_FULL_39_21]OFZ43960.1 MAG: hypothetical protein A2485_04400 [Bdellovibrionales bacterium RIFOXYC12_FULL_39_17]OFZ48332.1 MAG: hypothetical protein A2404_01815 [Bdellovibrionales bacterium RIFOXYC1_FULL_39_130]OFZ76637.1 MAG: hypothetical protein A2560_17410 [Bdellovibrionales bacterium RIFOXYD1_FULL_39_84]OFZ94923.1 MAG: hypothetical protein A2504_10095 [Bdellovibrionales bacterium RIFOXYD12_FULL_39_22]HLE12655.1 hy